MIIFGWSLATTRLCVLLNLKILSNVAIKRVLNFAESLVCSMIELQSSLFAPDHCQVFFKTTRQLVTELCRLSAVTSQSLWVNCRGSLVDSIEMSLPEGYGLQALPIGIRSAGLLNFVTDQKGCFTSHN